MEFESTYRLFKTSWGILINTRAEIFESNSLDSFLDDAYVMHNVFLRLNIDKSDKYIYENINLLIDGIKWVINCFPNNGKYMCLAINQIDFNFCNFQLEGLHLAIAKWVCDYYNMPLPNYCVDYDIDTKKYIFKFTNSESDL